MKIPLGKNTPFDHLSRIHMEQNYT